MTQFLPVTSAQNETYARRINISPLTSVINAQQKRQVRLVNLYRGCNLWIVPFNFNPHLSDGLFPLMIIMAFLQSCTLQVKRCPVPLCRPDIKKRINERKSVQSVSSWCHTGLNVHDYKGALMQNTSKSLFTRSAPIAGARFLHSIWCVGHGRVLNKSV